MVKMRLFFSLPFLFILWISINNLIAFHISIPQDTLYICSEKESSIIALSDSNLSDIDISWEVDIIADGSDEFVVRESPSQDTFFFIPFTPGTYKVIATTESIGDSVSADSVILIVLSECVLPGDADLDFLANNYDVLTMGLAFNSKGPIRPDAHTNFTPQGALPWVQRHLSGTNFVHADADGNGIVDDIDIAIIDTNYRPILVDSEGPRGTPIDPEIYLDLPTEADPGTTISGEIFLGTEEIPVSDFYGIAFSFDYDPKVVANQPIEISVTDSWIGRLNQDIKLFAKDLRDLGRVDVAITRIDQIDIDGFGKLGDIIITIDDITGKKTDLAQLEWAISNVRAIRKDGSFIPILNHGLQIGKPLSNKPELAKGKLRIYPNPTESLLYISSESLTTSSNSTRIQEIQIIDLQGKTIINKEFQSTQSYSVSVDSLTPGYYGIIVDTDEGRWVDKFWVYK